MAEARFSAQIGRQISLPGHFDVPVLLEDVRALGEEGSSGYECRVRLPDGTLEEAVISAAEAATLCDENRLAACPTIKPADAEQDEDDLDDQVRDQLVDEYTERWNWNSFAPRARHSRNSSNRPGSF